MIRADMTREEALKKLLEPITWSWSSPVRARQNHVIHRREEVATIYPFLTLEEKKLANKWFKDEAHEGLWD